MNGLATLAPTAQWSAGVAYGAHLGGFAAGLLLALVLPQRRPPPAGPPLPMTAP